MKPSLIVAKILLLLTLLIFSKPTLSTVVNTSTEPINSLPSLTTTYSPKGKESKIQATTNNLSADLPIYTIGDNFQKNAKSQAMIFIYDIYGFNGGRTRLLVDDLSYRGYFVVLPDFFRGDHRDVDANFMTRLAGYTWEKINIDMKAVINYLKEQGYDKFSIVGACWGGWIVFETSRVYQTQVMAGISYHPSLSPTRITTKTVDEFGDLINTPQLLIATKQEGVEVKPGGVIETKLKSRLGSNKVTFKSYENMSHGFVTRGDASVEEIKTAFLETVKMTYDFLDEFAKASPYVVNYDEADVSDPLRIIVWLVVLLGIIF